MTPEQRQRARAAYEQARGMTPEQRAALREKLRTMPPEQRREWLRRHRAGQDPAGQRRSGQEPRR
jgi:hypothetical protein